MTNFEQHLIKRWRSLADKSAFTRWRRFYKSKLKL